MIGDRESLDLDMEKLMDAAREKGCFMEVNTQSERLDLKDIHCGMAKESGVKVAISTDAHTLNDLGKMRFGVWQGHRGWFEPDDVLNRRFWEDIKYLLRR